MKFVCLIENRNEYQLQRADLLEQACADRNIDFELIVGDEFNFLNIDKYKEESFMMYRSSRGRVIREIEKSIYHEGVATLYTNEENVYRRVAALPMYYKNNVPVPKGINHLTNDRELLKEYVNYLGGFPIIVRSTSFSRGVGVMRVDSMISLQSVADYLTAVGQNVVLREYVPHEYQARLIVLGDKVIASNRNSNKGDFRTNAGDMESRRIEAFEFPEDVKQIALTAIKDLGIEFGGIDIIFDKDNKPYLTETNFPCDFSLTQRITGVDIAGAIVDHLQAKMK